MGNLNLQPDPTNCVKKKKPTKSEIRDLFNFFFFLTKNSFNFFVEHAIGSC